MKQPTAYIISGVPGSGKSHWSKEFVSDSKRGMDTVIVCKDKIREMFYGKYKFKPSMEELVHTTSIEMVKRVLNQGLSVIIDETTVNEKRRKQWVDLIKSDVINGENIKIVFVWVKSSENNLNNRMKESKGVSRKKWEFIIDSMEKKFFPPQEHELYDELIVIEPFIEEDITIKQDNTLTTAIVCDLDGTLALLNGRDPYDASTCEDDLINENVLELINYYLSMDNEIIFVSGRSSEYKEQTKRFLVKCDLIEGLHYNLYMRRENDMRKDSIIKEEIYREFILPNYFVKLILDDRNQVVDHMRDLGFTVFQVAKGDF